MPVDRIQASVGMHHNGSTNCYNLPQDVATIIRLLNSIAAAEGGTESTPLPQSASARQLFQAIQHFQERQNSLGHIPRLSVDGHVDPAAATLARLSEIAGRNRPGKRNPQFDPGAKLEVQALLDHNRPAIPGMLAAAIRALQNCQAAFELVRTKPLESQQALRANALAIDALFKFFHVSGGNDRLLPAIIENYSKLLAAFPRVARDQAATDYQTFLREDPDVALDKDGKPAKVPAFSDTVKNKMFFNPIYRAPDGQFPFPFDGFDPSQFPGIQIHEMCHFYLGFDDGNFRISTAEQCVKLPDSYRFFAQQITGRLVPS